jgi:hypothetical protein
VLDPRRAGGGRAPGAATHSAALRRRRPRVQALRGIATGVPRARMEAQFFGKTIAERRARATGDLASVSPTPSRRRAHGRSRHSATT